MGIELENVSALDVLLISFLVGVGVALGWKTVDAFIFIIAGFAAWAMGLLK